MPSQALMPPHQLTDEVDGRLTRAQHYTPISHRNYDTELHGSGTARHGYGTVLHGHGTALPRLCTVVHGACTNA
jgi:hypothetical protein